MRETQIGAMFAGADDGKWRQELVYILKRPPAHDRQPSAQHARKTRQQAGQFRRDNHRVGCFGDFDQRAIEIEEQRGRMINLRRAHKPSTPKLP